MFSFRAIVLKKGVIKYEAMKEKQNIYNHLLPDSKKYNFETGRISRRKTKPINTCHNILTFKFQTFLFKAFLVYV